MGKGGGRKVSKLARRVKREARNAGYVPREYVPGELELDTVTVADIRCIELSDNSIDMAFTDPPYAEEAVPLYEVLAERASRFLKPGGMLIAYTGNFHLPQVLVALGKHLEWIWVAAEFHSSSEQRGWDRKMFGKIRLLVVFTKPGETARREWVPDGLWTSKHKTHHDWERSEDAPRLYIDAYTSLGDVVWDPFAGGGTTAAVCKALGRHFITSDIDPETVRTTMARLDQVEEEEAEDSAEGGDGEIAAGSPSESDVPQVLATQPAPLPLPTGDVEWVDTACVSANGIHTVADLFCGCGGLSKGFEMAGYRPLLAIESDPRAAAIHRANFPDTRLLVSPIEALSDDEILNALGGATVDVLAG